MKRIVAMSLLAVAIIFGCGQERMAAQQSPPAAKPAAASGTVLNLFISGNRASRLESCGCHSRQQGGVQYEAVLYDQHAGAPSLRVDLGNWATSSINQKPVDLMATRYLLRALKMLQFDAVNIGLRDTELIADYFKAFSEKYPGQMPPLVSANVFLKEQPQKHVFEAYHIVEKKLPDGTAIKVGITGVAWLSDEDYNVPRGSREPDRREMASYVIRLPLESLKPVIEELRPKVDLLVVLNSGDVPGGAQIGKAFPQTDIVISRNAYEITGIRESQEGNVRLLFGRSSQGKELGFVPLARGADKAWQLAARLEFLPVAKDVAPKQEYLNLIEEFKKETQTLKPVPRPKNAQDLYAGAVSCQLCHPKEFAQWKTTQHAHAMATLINKGQQFNPNCTKCHVTGFQKENGFYGINDRQSQGLTDVQCENCHGPGQIHANAQYMKKAGGAGFMGAEAFKAKMDEELKNRPPKQVPEKVCLGCHTPENDDSWNYKVKVEKIKHGR